MGLTRDCTSSIVRLRLNNGPMRPYLTMEGRCGLYEYRSHDTVLPGSGGEAALHPLLGVVFSSTHRTVIHQSPDILVTCNDCDIHWNIVI